MTIKHTTNKFQVHANPILYRGDSRSPKTVFNEGLQPRRLQYPASTLTTLPFQSLSSKSVCFTSKLSAAGHFPIPQKKESYIYVVKPKVAYIANVHQQSFERSDSSSIFKYAHTEFPNEQLVLGGVKKEDIMGAFKIKRTFFDYAIGHRTFFDRIRGRQGRLKEINGHVKEFEICEFIENPMYNSEEKRLSVFLKRQLEQKVGTCIKLRGEATDVRQHELSMITTALNFIVERKQNPGLFPEGSNMLMWEHYKNKHGANVTEETPVYFQELYEYIVKNKFIGIMDKVDFSNNEQIYGQLVSVIQKMSALAKSEIVISNSSPTPVTWDGGKEVPVLVIKAKIMNQIKTIHRLCVETAASNAPSNQ